MIMTSQMYINHPVNFRKTNDKNAEKLHYKLKLRNKNITIKIVSELTHTFRIENDVFYHISNNSQIDDITEYNFLIKKCDDTYKIVFNNETILVIEDYDNILLQLDDKYFDISIIYPLGLEKFTTENFSNLNYLLSSSDKFSDNYQYCICHTDSRDASINFSIFDEWIINSNFNYIYVEKPKKYNFNLGYCRNLYRYLCLSDNVMFNDIDIPVPENIYASVFRKLQKGYDIVSPYTNSVIYTNLAEKNEWLNNYNLTADDYNTFLSKIKNRIHQTKLLTITGGITAFKREILDNLGGYTEINGYCYEDRFLDVIVLDDKNIKIKQLNNTVIHLYHQSERISPSSPYARKINIYNEKYYNCYWNKNSVTDIHKLCEHNTEYLDKLIKQKQTYNANLKLFVNNPYSDNVDLKKDLESL